MLHFKMWIPDVLKLFLFDKFIKDISLGLGTLTGSWGWSGRE